MNEELHSTMWEGHFSINTVKVANMDIWETWVEWGYEEGGGGVDFGESTSFDDAVIRHIDIAMMLGTKPYDEIMEIFSRMKATRMNNIPNGEV